MQDYVYTIIRSLKPGLYNMYRKVAFSIYINTNLYRKMLFCKYDNRILYRIVAFEEKMKKLTLELKEQMAKAKELDEQIIKNLSSIGYTL
mgnify:FL=1